MFSYCRLDMNFFWHIIDKTVLTETIFNKHSMFLEVISALPCCCLILSVKLSVLCITLMIIMKTDSTIIFQNTFQVPVLILAMFESSQTAAGYFNFNISLVFLYPDTCVQWMKQSSNMIPYRYKSVADIEESQTFLTTWTKLIVSDILTTTNYAQPPHSDRSVHVSLFDLERWRQYLPPKLRALSKLLGVKPTRQYYTELGSIQETSEFVSQALPVSL
jgi:hypothetical protein